MLVEKRVQVEKLAKALLTREVLFQSDVEILIGKRPYEEKKPVHVADSDADQHHHSHNGSSQEGMIIAPPEQTTMDISSEPV